MTIQNSINNVQSALNSMSYHPRTMSLMPRYGVMDMPFNPVGVLQGNNYTGAIDQFPRYQRYSGYPEGFYGTPNGTSNLLQWYQQYQQDPTLQVPLNPAIAGAPNPVPQAGPQAVPPGPQQNRMAAPGTFQGQAAPLAPPVKGTGTLPPNQPSIGGNMFNTPPAGVSEAEWSHPLWRAIWLQQNPKWSPGGGPGVATPPSPQPVPILNTPRG